MNEVGVEIVKTEETEKSGIKYLNINVSNSEVERNPDIVRLCADAGILEYVKTSGETVSLGVFKQVMWERDIAIEQLKELGYGFGQKIEPCNDLISLEDAIETIASADITDGIEPVFSGKQVIALLKDLDTITPQEQKWNRLYSWLNDMRLGIAPDENTPEWMLKAESEG